MAPGGLKRKVMIAAAAVVVSLLLCTPVFGNLIQMVFEPYYVIPEESSIFSFHTITGNPGSGDWWESGEDRNYYYFRIDSDGVFYYIFPKSRVEECPGFQPSDITSWCESIRSARPSAGARQKNFLSSILH